MILYELNDNKIFDVSFEDKITLDDILYYLKKFETFDYLPSDIKLLYNFTKSIFNFTPEQIQIISELADKAVGKYKSVKTACLVSKPIMTAYSYLLTGMDENPNRQRKVFSTEEAAFKWLLDD